MVVNLAPRNREDLCKAVVRHLRTSHIGKRLRLKTIARSEGYISIITLREFQFIGVCQRCLRNGPINRVAERAIIEQLHRAGTDIRRSIPIRHKECKDLIFILGDCTRGYRTSVVGKNPRLSITLPALRKIHIIAKVVTVVVGAGNQIGFRAKTRLCRQLNLEGLGSIALIAHTHLNSPFVTASLGGHLGLYALDFGQGLNAKIDTLGAGNAHHYTKNQCNSSGQ